MSTHPYLRAYMAGIVVPTMFLLIGMTGFTLARHVYGVPIPIERVIVFPMALVPNLFGGWNMLYVLLHSRRYLPIGLHGAILPFVLAPIAFTVTTLLGVLEITPAGLVLFQIITIRYIYFAFYFSLVLAVYYLLWKHLVGFLNELLGIT